MKTYRFIRLDWGASEDMTGALIDALRDEEEVHSFQATEDEVVVLVSCEMDDDE